MWLVVPMGLSMCCSGTFLPWAKVTRAGSRLTSELFPWGVVGSNQEYLQLSPQRSLLPAGETFSDTLTAGGPCYLKGICLVRDPPFYWGWLVPDQKQIVNRSINKRFNGVNDDRSVSSITVLQFSLRRPHEIKREHNLSYWNEMHFNNHQDRIC